VSADIQRVEDEPSVAGQDLVPVYISVVCLGFEALPAQMAEPSASHDPGTMVGLFASSGFQVHPCVVEAKPYLRAIK